MKLGCEQLSLYKIEIWLFSATAFINALVTLTFDLSICKWGHGSPMSWASFLRIFIFLCQSQHRRAPFASVPRVFDVDLAPTRDGKEP